MTELKTHYKTPGSDNLKIPSREEFHRYKQNNLTLSDFDTDHRSQDGVQAAKVGQSIKWTLSRYNTYKKNLEFRDTKGQKYA